MAVTHDPFVILLVEDNDDHAEIVMRTLRNHRPGDSIFHVTDGQEAIDFLFHQEKYAGDNKAPRPNLVLLDLRLPRIDGLDVLRTIKESEDLRRIPVVILTSSSAESDVARSYDLHANSYVVKPFDFSTFASLMRDVGSYWLGWNTKPIHPENKGGLNG